MKVKELIEILQEYANDDLEVCLEYNSGYILEIDKGDCFHIDDYNITNKAVYLEFQ